MQPVTANVNSAALAAATAGAKTAHRTPDQAREPAESGPQKQDVDVVQAARQVETFVQAMSSDLQFSVDESSGSNVVRVIDRATKEVIRQIPSEEMLAIARALDRIQGLLIRQKA